LNSKQDKLREQARVARAINHDCFTYADFADYLEISVNSFYNWLNGYYDLSSKKADNLNSFLSDLL